MAYTDYRFYTTKYHGKLKEEEFEEYADKASDWLDVPTFSRLHAGIPEDEISSAKIQKCVCAIAETLYKFQRAEDMAEMSMSADTVGNVAKIDGNAVKSVSSGSESVTYLTPSEIMNGAKGASASYAAAGDEKAQDILLINIAKKYLVGVSDMTGTPLLFAGL